MKCCICGKEIVGLGNNPDPLTKEDGSYFDLEKERCCDECNEKYVVPARLAQLLNNKEDFDLIQNQVKRLRARKLILLMMTIQRKDDKSIFHQRAQIINNDIHDSLIAAEKLLGNDYVIINYIDEWSEEE